MNTSLVENEVEDVWKEVIQWAALSGKIGTIVARDCPTTPLDQVIAGPHQLHFLHALLLVRREQYGGGRRKFYVEDLEHIKNIIGAGDAATLSMWPPYRLDARTPGTIWMRWACRMFTLTSLWVTAAYAWQS